MTDPRIVVPLDGSAFAESAIPHAVSLAKTFEIGLELLSVVYDLDLVAAGEPALAAFPPSAAEEQKWRLEEYLEEVTKKIAELHDLAVAHRVIRGIVPQSLEEHINETEPQLVVMSTHGRGLLSRAWLGSVADHVIRHVTIPLLLIRPEETEEADLGRVVNYDRILVAADGTPQSERCLVWSTRLARAAGSLVRIVRVVPPAPMIQSVYLPDAVFETKQFMEDGKLGAERYVNGLRERMKEDGVEVEVEVLVGYQPAVGILRAADDNLSDLIAVGTHGRAGLSRLALGSVADKVIRGAHIPVLVTRC